ncbi:MAG: zinc-dependent metalloprotease family protein [Phormidesmis sp.]
MKYSIRLPFGRVFSRSKSLPLLVGAALALGGCAEGGAQSVQSIAFGEADELFVQPIRVCDDNGKSCADVNLFEDITRKILEQAQLKVSFLPTNQLNASRFLRIEDARNRNSPDYEFYELTRTGGAGAFGRHPDSTRDSGPINVWFVDEIEAINGFTQFGVAWVGSNGVLVSQDSLDFNGGVGRTDTVAHEISHNLGLRHATLGAGSPKNLATDGDDRLIPSLLSDIGIDGAGLSVLTDAQIKAIQNSSFVREGVPGILSEEIAAADSATARLSDEAAIAETLPLDSLASANLALSEPVAATSAASATAAVSVPESDGLLGLSVIALSFVTVRRRWPARQSQSDSQL